jgi:L-lactate dehydrogenase (cytochrome)
MLRSGRPRLRVLEQYIQSNDMNQFLAFVGNELNGTLDWEYLKRVRDEWDGPLVLKGVLAVEEAEQAVAAGVDGIQVSNHGGRHLDAAPAAIDALPAIARAVGGSARILFDSGVRSGLDIARALALGADYVLLGRAFMFGVGALGERGGDYVAGLLYEDLRNNMSQLGCKTLADLRHRLPVASS